MFECFPKKLKDIIDPIQFVYVFTRVRNCGLICEEPTPQEKGYNMQKLKEM